MPKLTYTKPTIKRQIPIRFDLPYFEKLEAKAKDDGKKIAVVVRAIVARFFDEDCLTMSGLFCVDKDGSGWVMAGGMESVHRDGNRWTYGCCEKDKPYAEISLEKERPPGTEQMTFDDEPVKVTIKIEVE